MRIPRLRCAALGMTRSGTQYRVPGTPVYESVAVHTCSADLRAQGFHPPNTFSTVYSAASEAESCRRAGALTAPGPFVPNSYIRLSAGSYHVRAPVESTDDIRSHPRAPM